MPSEKKGGQRSGLIARNWGMQTGLVAWLKEKQKDQGGTNKGRAVAWMGKKAKPLGKNDVLDTHGVLFWGLVTPGDFSRGEEGLVKWLHCFCVTVFTIHSVQQIVMTVLRWSPSIHPINTLSNIDHEIIWIICRSGNWCPHTFPYIYMAAVSWWNAIWSFVETLTTLLIPLQLHQ